MNEIKPRNCPICGGSIYFEYGPSTRIFCFNDNDELMEEPKLYLGNDFSAYCEDDKDHNLEVGFKVLHLDFFKVFENWVDNIYEDLRMKNIII